MKKTEHWNLRVSEEENKRVKQAARRDGRTVSNAIRHAVDQFCRRVMGNNEKEVENV